MYLYCIVLYCISLGPQPVVQCFLTSALGKFPGNWDWLLYPGLPSVLCPLPFPHSPAISRCFSIHSSSFFFFFFFFFFAIFFFSLSSFFSSYPFLWVVLKGL